jgi:hypothetical protein
VCDVRARSIRAHERLALPAWHTSAGIGQVISKVIPPRPAGGQFVSFFFPARSAVIAHHSARALSLARVAIGQYGREFLDSSYCFLTQGRRFACNACLAQPFDVGDAAIEGVNKLPQRMYDEIAI